ncbi:MAG: 4-hydroxy-tetrahydrodipicolinate synthase [Erysipelotrichaceae bacterium]
MKKIMVALITPFLKDGFIDYASLEKIVLRLLDEGIDGFIVCGTTSEVCTLSREERFQVLNYVIKLCSHRCEIWFGCGTNNTKETLELMQASQSHEIDGYLIVTPYYNKPSDAGLYKHYERLAKQSILPIMLYNVPKRSGVCLSYPLIRKLIKHYPNITSLKQASDDYETVKKLKEEFPFFKIYCGEDAALSSGLDAGMDGIISVSGHCYLKDIQNFIKAYQNHQPITDFDKRIKDIATTTFCDASPAPIKYILNQRGECHNVLRLPLVPITKANKNKIDAFLHDSTKF